MDGDKTITEELNFVHVGKGITVKLSPANKEKVGAHFVLAPKVEATEAVDDFAAALRIMKEGREARKKPYETCR